MRQYMTRRLLEMIPVLIGLSLVIFLIFQLAPGDAVSGMMGPHVTAEMKQQMRHNLHLDQPKIVQYGCWVKGMVHGDFGESFYYKQPVGHIMNQFIWNSFYLGIASFLISFLLAIPIGVISATKQYSAYDNFFTVFALIGLSMPGFFFALLLIKWFAVDFKVFPVSGMSTAGATYTGFKAFKDTMYHMMLPLVVLGLGEVAGVMRYVRSSMLEVIRQDYIRTARAKGLKEKVVIYKHALRNGLIPVITLIGFSLPGLFSGAVITEQIFAWPGIGPVQIIAINARDYPLLMGINMLLAVLTLLGNLIADISYALVDPRIRFK